MLRVTPDVLTPRPDTESLLDVLLPRIPIDRPASMLDLGVGSGAILLAILAERPSGARAGRRHLSRRRSRWRARMPPISAWPAGSPSLRGDWTAGLAPGSFDVVVANPPYVASGEIATLAPEVRDHEPRLALDGGLDGLDAYRIIAAPALAVLRPGGVFAVEVGLGQSRGGASCCSAQAGAIGVTTANDLTGRPRVVAWDQESTWRITRRTV